MEKGISNSRLVRNGYLILAAAFFFFIFIQTARSATHIKAGKDRVPGQLIVKLKDAPEGQRLQGTMLQSLNQVLGSDAVVSIEPLMTDASLNVVTFKSDSLLQDASRILSENTQVEYSEPNYILRALGIPDDADFSKLWGMLNNGQRDSAGQEGIPGADINVMPVWEMGHTGSREVTVAVIDTGVSWDHPDLKDNIWTNEGEAGELASNGIDDDGNGYIDDVHGFNFITDNNQSQDDHNHGTHCAGTIGGVGNNAIGVAGVAHQVSIVPIKFLSSSGSGTLANAVESINYATAIGVDIMSNSWGGGGYMESMHNAVLASKEKGILFVAAAGNSSNDNDARPAYPATYDSDNIVSVAATDNRDALASFSSYGATKVHVAAPGVKVYSTTKDGGYASYSGTSMATPHVAGAAALLKSIHPEWSYTEIKERLINTSDPIRALRRKVAARGRINVHNALTNTIPPSDEPDENAWVDVEYVVETPHPYETNKEYTYEISHPGAKFIRVHFERIETEARYDPVYVEGPDGSRVEALSGTRENFTSDYVTGDKVIVRLKSDYSKVKWGFKIDKIQVITE